MNVDQLKSDKMMLPYLKPWCHSTIEFVAKEKIAAKREFKSDIAKNKCET